jgi:hypothetical protein
MSRLCHSLDELILNSCQLTNYGKTYHVHVYKSNTQRNIKGVLTARIDQGQLIFIGGEGSANIMSKPFDFVLDIADIETISQVRMLIRQLLLSHDWRYIVKTTRRI